MERSIPQERVVKKETKIDLKWVNEIVRLYGEGFCGCEPYWEIDSEEAVTTELAETVEDPNLLILTFPCGDGLAGFLIATSVDPERFTSLPNRSALQKTTENDLYILELAVDRRFRKKGIGSRLVGKAVKIAQETGKSGVTLRADLRNTPAIRLYQKLSFALITENVGTNPFDIYIRKDLSRPESNNGQTLGTGCVQLLFKDYPPEEYLFLVNYGEIEGWRVATSSKNAILRLGFDSKNWTPLASQSTERFSRIVWVTKRPPGNNKQKR